MNKREIALMIYEVEKPKNDKSTFIKKMCDAYSKDVLLLILKTAKENNNRG